MTHPSGATLAALLNARSQQTIGRPVASVSAIVRPPSVAAPSPREASEAATAGDAEDIGVIPTPTLDDAAFAGPLGALVRAIEPHTEAPAAALLFSALTVYGSMIGPGPVQLLDGRPHGTNLDVFIVGDTSSARKGTGYHRIRREMLDVDPEFMKANVTSGLSTGEGLIHRVRDATTVEDGDGQKTIDPGVTDKRLLVVEEETGVVFRRASSRESTILLVIRQTWDGVQLNTMTRKASMTATHTHVSIIAQITGAELLHSATDVDFQGGTLNRFGYCFSERARILPDGGDPDDNVVEPIRQQLRDALAFARTVQRIELDPSGRAWWHAHYEALTTGAPGRYGQATRRGAPIVRRVAAIYCLSECRHEITASDLVAALAIWNYSCASAARVFGRTELSARAERLLTAIEQAGATGASRSVLRAVVGNRLAAKEITVALVELRDAGLARVEHIKSTGRPVELWRSTSAALSLKERNNGDNGGKPTEEAPLSPLSPLSPSSRENTDGAPKVRRFF